MIYAYPGDPPANFDNIIDGPEDVYIGLKLVGQIWYLTVRGSVTVEDWLHNLDAISVEVADLGRIHAGFYAGLEVAWKKVKVIIGNAPLILAGHSRGAGQATILTGLAIRDGLKPLARYAFGEPRSGCGKLARLLAGTPGKSYRNGNAKQTSWDPVTDVPFDIPLIEPYQHVMALTHISMPPPPNDPWPGDLCYHHMQLYEEFIAKEAA